jgi:hypothetical protein
LNGGFYTVIQTLNPGKGALVREGLHVCVAHDASTLLMSQGLERSEAISRVCKSCDELKLVAESHSFNLGFPVQQCDFVFQVARDWIGSQKEEL